MSLAFDESMHRAMSNYLVAVNRLRHARDRGPGLAEPDAIKALEQAEAQAEYDCLQALVQRGWQPPFALIRRPA